MSNSSFDSETFDSETELSDDDVELLARARKQLHGESVPRAIRERLLAHLLAEERQGHPIAVPAAQLVTVPRRTARGLGLAGALALGIFMLAHARELATGFAERAALEPEAPAHAAGEGLLQSPVFRAPARRLSADELPPAAPNLFGERPFAALGGAWQVRRWNDLRTDPVEPAAYDFAEGALCVALGAGERTLGGWPWPPPGGISPEKVKVSAGQPYRLMFKAWAKEPLPAQLLMAIGHDRLPFSAVAGARVAVSTEAQPFVVDFVADRDDPSVGIAFLATNAEDSEPTRVCLSDVTLSKR